MGAVPRDAAGGGGAQKGSGPMAGRTVLVTGGTGGIGKATALGLARMGAHLAITGRDRGRAEGAAREIRAAGGGQVDVFAGDLSCQAEVRRLADEVLQCLPRIDVLVKQRRGVLGHPARDRGRARAHLRRQPSRPVPAHLAAPGAVMRPFMKSPARGAATSVHVASAPDLEQVTGRYFANSKPRKSSNRSYDQAVAARLWQVSADLAGLGTR
jgi:NAD(P)-dependent dehydrogenase (short-subunit alcohol dehydrogenase family)